MIVEGVKVIPDDVGLYAPDDIPAFVEKYRKQTAKMPRKRRTDFSKGMIVIVLEGAFSSARVVYLRKEENYLALCAGPKSVNGIPFFKIDERYLLTTSTILDFSEDIRIDSKNVYESVRDVYMEPIDVEIRLRQKKSLQQFASLDSEDVIMKVAFLAVIVVVLAIQGSEAILGLPLGGGITLDPIIQTILGAVEGLLGQLPVPAGALPCKLADIVPSITLFTDLIGADYKKAATVIIKCPQQVSCTLYAKVDLSAIEAAVKLECDAPGILPGPNPTVVEVKVSLKGLPGLPLPPLPALPL